MRYPFLVVAFAAVGAAHIHHDMAIQLDSSPMKIHVSPQCQKNALQVLDGHFGHALGGQYCRVLSYTQTQLLALELTKCHLDELQQDTFENPCSSSVHECLAQLTPLGFQSYTMFKINVEQYCMKLNHELMILQQQETGAQLQETTKLASRQIAELIARQGEIKDDYSRLYSSLRKEQSELHHSLLEQAVQLQHASEQQLFEWTNKMMKGQAQQMQLQREELQDLSNVVGKTASKIKNALNLDSVISFLSGGIKVANMFVYTYATVHIQWFLTLPRCVRSCRGKLWTLAMLELLLMALFIWFNDNATSSAIELFAERVRFFSRTLQGAIYLISFISSLFTKEPLADGDQHKQLTVALESLKDSIKEIQVELDMREERLVRRLSDQYFDNELRVIRQDHLRRHVGLNIPMRENPSQQVPYGSGWQAHQCQYQDNARDNVSHMISSRRHPGEVEQSLLMHHLLASHVESCSPLTRLPADSFFDAAEDALAVTPSPQRDQHECASEDDGVNRKRPLANSDACKPLFKKHRACSTGSLGAQS